MCGRDLELPRPDQQVRGEGVWPGADTQVSKQSNRGGHSRVWHTIRTQSGRQGTQPAPRFTHQARLKRRVLHNTRTVSWTLPSCCFSAGERPQGCSHPHPSGQRNHSHSHQAKDRLSLRL